MKIGINALLPAWEVYEKKESWNNVQSHGPLYYTKHTTLSLISQCCVNLDLDQRTLVVPLIGDGVVHQRLPEHLQHCTVANSENIRLQLPIKGAMSGG
jgi:hypothetical protein